MSYIWTQIKITLKKSLILISFFFAAILFSVLIGSVMIPLSSGIKILIGLGSENEVWDNIIINHRLPRVLAAILAGSSLSVSGMFMQTFFRNPLAGPYVLGVSSGASLGIAILLLGGSLFGAYGLIIASKLSMVLSAVAGAGLVFFVIILFAQKVIDHTSLLIIGLMFSSATSALVSILQFFSNASDIQSYLMWTFGDVSSVTYADLKILGFIVGLGGLGSVFLIKTLNIYLLGDEYARNAGLNIWLSRYSIISLTALLSGVITAYCGPIAFVGLATPHIARMILDDSDHKKLLPNTALLGALIMLVCDMIARLPGLPETLPLNAVTSILGGPIVIWLIVKKNNLQRSF